MTKSRRMEELNEFFDKRLKEIAEGEKPVQEKQPPTRDFSKLTPKPEANVRFFEISSIDIKLLLELRDFLQSNSINMNQPSLKKGVVSRGYEGKGLKELGDGRISIRLGDTNYVIVGTPKEFVEALKKAGS